MRSLRSVTDFVLLVACILACTTVGSRLWSGDDKFDDTPQGAYAKCRAAVEARDVEMLRTCVTGIPDSLFAEIKAQWAGTSELTEAKASLLLATAVAFDAKSCAEEGDKATLSLDIPEGLLLSKRMAVRLQGVWRIDLSDVAAADFQCKARDCTNNLRRLGMHLIEYVSKYGNKKDYPGPGIRMLTDLFNLPSPDKAICQEPALLVCKLAGDKVDNDLIRKNDPACTSYECIDQKLADGVTQPGWPIAWDKKPHADGTRNVLLFGGNVTAMTEEEFKKSLKQWPGK